MTKFLFYIFAYLFVESLSKLDVIAIILRNAYRNCDYEELYSILKSNITMQELIKFLFELRKYNLLIYSEGQNNKITITTKGMQYMQIHEDLMNQILPRNNKISGIFNRPIQLLKLPTLFNKYSIRSIR
jgi:predicted transcriptional regulator